MRKLAFAFALLALRVPLPADDGCGPFSENIRGALRTSGVPGLAIAVVREDRVLCVGAFGMRDLDRALPVTPETAFYIASAAKPFTALAAKLVSLDQKLDLDAPLTSTIPRLALPAPLDPARMSLRDLLTHRLGFECDAYTWRTAYTGDWTEPQLFDVLRTDAVVTPRVFRYTNLGYNLAGAALRNATGEDWQTVLETRVFRPAGLTRTFTRSSEIRGDDVAVPYGFTGRSWARVTAKTDRTMHPAGGFYSSVTDLARWVRVNLGEGVVDGRRVFPAEAMREVHAPQIDLSKKFGRIRRYAYALGWYHGDHDGDLLVHHFGSYPGAWAHLSFMPDRRIAVAAVSNAETPLPDAVALYVYDSLLGKPGAASRLDEDARSIAARLARTPDALSKIRRKLAEESRDSARTLPSYAGVYVNDAWGTLEVVESHGKLTATAGLLTTTLERVRGDAFLAPWLAGDEPERVVFGDEGLTKDGVVFTRRAARAAAGAPPPPR